MVAERELIQAIEECEQDPITYNNIEKLANLYTVYGHLYGSKAHSYESRETVENTIGEYGDSEFLLLVRGKNANSVWSILDELLEVLKVTNPRLYDGVLRKLDN